MVRVSKQILSEKIERKLRDNLENLFVANVTKKEFGKVLFELLSPSERIMLAKRLGIINALSQGYASHTIATLFKVSPSTVFRIQDKAEKNGFPRITSILKKKIGRSTFLKTLESFATLGFPGVPQKRLRAQINRDIEQWKQGG